MSNEENKIVLTLRKVNYDVNYTTEQCADDVKKFSFVISGDLYRALENEAYFKTKNSFNVVGFRKGKAPLHTIKKIYGDYAFLEDMIDIAVNEVYRAFYNEVIPTLQMAARPDLEYGQCDTEQIAFTFGIVEYPTLSNLTYKGLDVVKVGAEEVTDEMVEAELNKARDKAGYWADVTDRAVVEGDRTVINYSGSIDGVVFEGGTASEQELEIGSHRFIPGFEEQIVGMNVGEERDINVTFPTEYGAEELAGKDAVFHIELLSVKAKVLPEADDEFAKDVSEFDTLEALKESYRAKLVESNAAKAKDTTEKNLIKAVIEATPVTLNEKIVEEAAEARVEEFEEMLSRSGMNFADYERYTGVTREKMIEDYKESSRESEIRSLVLTEIVKAENLQVTPEEMDAKIAELAEKTGKTPEVYKQEMKREEFNGLFNSLLSDKLIDFLLANNNLINA